MMIKPMQLNACITKHDFWLFLDVHSPMMADIDSCIDKIATNPGIEGVLTRQFWSI